MKINDCTNGGHNMWSDGSCICGHFKPFETKKEKRDSKVVSVFEETDLTIVIYDKETGNFKKKRTIKV